MAFFKDETLDKIFSSLVPTDNDDYQYGFGWLISNISGQEIIEHGGRVWGFVARIRRYPDDQATIIVLSNYDVIDPEMIT